MQNECAADMSLPYLVWRNMDVAAILADISFCLRCQLETPQTDTRRLLYLWPLTCAYLQGIS